ncbi:hypothetical protein AmDm5_2631 [Acetobacter malorum]|nr:hypothetical protein AmDm5_2631 [Acetobacter malorum]
MSGKPRSVTRLPITFDAFLPKSMRVGYMKARKTVLQCPPIP